MILKSENVTFLYGRDHLFSVFPYFFVRICHIFCNVRNAIKKLSDMEKNRSRQIFRVKKKKKTKSIFRILTNKTKNAGMVACAPILEEFWKM